MIYHEPVRCRARSEDWLPSTRRIGVSLAAAALVMSCGTADPTGQAALTPGSIAETTPPSAEPPATTRSAPSTSALEVTTDDGNDNTETGDAGTETGGTDEAPAAGLPPELVPSDAAGLATALTTAERTVRDPSLEPEELNAWGAWQQSLYRRLADHPEWLDQVAAEVDPEVRNAVDLNVVARQNLSALLATETLHDTMPAWRIVDPAPAAELLGYYKEAESLTGIQWEFVAAINLVETRMGRIRGVSTAGAVGPMQFLPTTWAECCDGDPTIPRDAIIGAATYLTHRGGPENMPKAIWGYNNSDFYVNAVTAYAEVMMEDERAYYGYHGWGIYFLTTEGLISIPVGYEQETEVPVSEWLVEHPDWLVDG